MYVLYRQLNGCTDFNQSWYMYNLDPRKKDNRSKKPKGKFFTYRSNIKIWKLLQSSFRAIYRYIAEKHTSTYVFTRQKVKFYSY